MLIVKILIAIVALLVAYQLFIVLFAVFASLFVGKGPIERQRPFCRAVIRMLAPIVCLYGGVRTRVIGEEKLPRDETFLLVSNHRHIFDPIVIINKLYKYNISFVMKPMVDKLPLIRTVARGLGCLCIDRENDRAALKTIVQAADYIKRGVCSIGIYPEGTRNRGEGLLEFRAGAFKAAQRAGSAVVVAVERGVDAMAKKTGPGA